MNNAIQSLLDGTCPDPQTRQPLHVPVKQVVIATGLQPDALVASLDMGRSYLVVSDRATHAVLGALVEKSLTLYNVSSLVLPVGALPDMKAVAQVSAALESCDAVIAVGSGTISDICKYASFRANKPYAVFGTAPSMNGYGSANASIVVDGHKKTLGAHLPQGIFLDLDILAAAPKRLIRSGLGDSLCRPTAQADWLLSHLVLGTPYREAPFSLLKEHEAALFDQSAALMAGDREAMRLLAETLVLSGFGMTLCGGSYPASQGEHMIAHAMEMAYGDQLPDTYHGEQIGVTTLTMAAVQERVMEIGTPRIKLEQGFEEAVSAFFGAAVGAECLEDYEAKAFSLEQMDTLNHHIETNWSQWAARLEAVMLPVATLERVLQDTGAPRQCTDLGWSGPQYGCAVLHAKYMRGRFGFLDVA